jgi:hypothetical protein
MQKKTFAHEKNDRHMFARSADVHGAFSYWCIDMYHTAYDCGDIIYIVLITEVKRICLAQQEMLKRRGLV